MLKHAEVEQRGWVEAYVRRELKPEDCAAFEEHYFTCDECFEAVEDMAKFVAGMKDAGRAGLLDPKPEPRVWALPAFATALAACVVLGTALSYFALVLLPRQAARAEMALASARDSQTRLAELDLRASGVNIPEANAPEANVPVVMLEANRAADPPPQLLADPQARSVLLWIDATPQPATAQFGITITGANGRYAKSVHGLRRNANAALTASLTIADLEEGPYSVRLFNEKSPAQTTAEYRFTVARR